MQHLLATHPPFHLRGVLRVPGLQGLYKGYIRIIGSKLGLYMEGGYNIRGRGLLGPQRTSR